ncbi:hypothetical protein [Intestinibacter sp.]
MNEVAIKRHSFDLAKNRLKEFSEKTEAQLEIDKVRTDGGFLGLGDHKVTGYELNRRLETIQNHFIAVNTTNNKVIKEFREVYNALDVLDKDYITSIVANVKAIEKTSNDVRIQQEILKQHNEKLANQQSKLDVHQGEIEKNVTNISKIVVTLKSFKEKLEGYQHLTDIDKIWNDCKSIRNEIRVVSDSLTKASKKATADIASANNKNKALSDQVNKDILTLRNEAKSFKEFFADLSERIENTVNLLDNQIPVIQETASYAEYLKNITHIDEVDSMWDDIGEAKENFKTIEDRLQNIESDILNMQKHIDEIDSFISILNGYTHLQDIDAIWDNVEICRSNIKAINEDIQSHQNELDMFSSTSAEHKESIDTLFKNLSDANEYAVESRNLIAELEVFRTKVSSLNHLMEVDYIWKETEDHQLRLKKVEQEGQSHLEKLNELVQADEKIRESIDANVQNITVQIAECKNRDEDLASAIQKNKDEVDKNISDAIQTTNAAVELLTKKIKYAYWFAGGATGIAIIELIVLLTKVM